MHQLKAFGIVALLLVTGLGHALDKKDDEPMNPLEKARRLATDKKFTQALEVYKELLAELDADELETDGVNHTHVYREMARTLAKGYQEVHVYLKSRVNQAENNVKAWEKGERAVTELVGLQDSMGLETYMVDLYDELKAEREDHPALAHLAPHLFSGLLKAKRYEDIHNIQDITERVEETIEDVGFKPRPEDIHRLADLYQVLLGLGRVEEASGLVEQVLEMDDHANTYNSLAWCGYLSGKGGWDNLELARQAYQLSDGRDIHIIDTLTRCLAAMGRHKEALTTLQKARENFYRRKDLILIDRAIREIQKTKATEEAPKSKKPKRGIESKF